MSDLPETCHLCSLELIVLGGTTDMTAITGCRHCDTPCPVTAAKGRRGKADDCDLCTRVTATEVAG